MQKLTGRWRDEDGGLKNLDQFSKSFCKDGVNMEVRLAHQLSL